MKNVLKDIGKGLLAILASMAVIVLIIGFGLVVKKVVNPISEEIRYETFNQSNAHIKGTVNDLRGLQATYSIAEPVQKPTLRAIIVKRADDIDSANMPTDLAFFVDDMRRKAQSPSYLDE